MTQKEMLVEEVKGLCRFFSHGVALLVGMLLLIVAMAMSVTLVLLPGGLVVGLFGFLLIVCGIYTKPHTHTGRR